MILLSFAREVTLQVDPDGPLRLAWPRGELPLPAPSAGIRDAFAAIHAGLSTEEQIAAIAALELPRLYVHLQALASRGVLRWTAVHGAAPLARLVPVSSHFSLPDAHLDDRRAYRLSRFAHLRPADPAPVIECPTSGAIVEILDPRAWAILFHLSRPLTLADLAASAPDLDFEAARDVMKILALAAMIAPEPDEGDPPSPTAIALRQWEPHDLLFHARSRAGRHASPVGATQRFEGEIPPPPVVRPAAPGAPIDLHRPDIEALRRADASFTDVLERRRSLRDPASSPLTARMLGELLFRSARLRGVHPTPHGDVGDRPYPGGGARHELEIYPVVRRCEGLAPGLYHYATDRHCLEPIAGSTPRVQALLEDARGATASTAPPEVLLVIAARFQRVSWRYESIAYALILKDTGVLLQTMYLVATAMGLSPCAVGMGDADLFARAAGTDYYAETSVGEMILGGPGSPRG